MVTHVTNTFIFYDFEKESIVCGVVTVYCGF